MARRNEEDSCPTRWLEDEKETNNSTCAHFPEETRWSASAHAGRQGVENTG